MAKESKHKADRGLIFRETFNSEAEVRRNGGDPDVGATSPTFENGIGVFDGVTAEINYPRSKFRLCEPERAFTIRTRVYLTDTDASSFIQLYDNGVPHQEFRFLICGIWPNAGDVDKLSLELWDDHGSGGSREMRGRKYDTALTTIALNKWTEFVATYDGRGGPTPEAGIRLYMDGVRVDDANVTLDNGGDYQYTEYNPELSYQVGRNVEGKMELLEVYNYVWSLEEVYNACHNSRFRDIIPLESGPVYTYPITAFADYAAGDLQYD